MNRRAVIRCALAGVLLAAGGPAHAQYALDRPARRLQLWVRFDDGVEIRAPDSRLRAEQHVDQRLQVLEGGHAMIYTGQSQPVRERRFVQTPGGVISQEVTVLQDTRMGFEVVPRLAGSTVQVEIGTANGYQTASGPLGEWFELGAVAGPSGSQRVWIRVDPL